MILMMKKLRKKVDETAVKLDIKILWKLANKDTTEVISSKVSSPLVQLLSHGLSHGLDVSDTEDSFGNSFHDSPNPSRNNSQKVKCEPENLGNVNDGPNNLSEVLIAGRQPISAPRGDISINTLNVNLSINDNRHEQNAGNSQIQIYVITNLARGIYI